MAKPSSVPGWGGTTTPAPDAGEQTAGFASGDKPPFQWVNWFWNLVSDWLTFLDTVPAVNHVTTIRYDGASLPFFSWGGIGSVEVEIDRLSNGKVDISHSVGTSGAAVAEINLEETLLTGVTVNVDAITDTAVITVSQLNANGSSAGFYSGTISATGDTALTAGGGNVAPTQPSRIQIKVEPESGTATAEIQIDTITLTFEAL